MKGREAPKRLSRRKEASGEAIELFILDGFSLFSVNYVHKHSISFASIGVHSGGGTRKFKGNGS